MDSVEFWCFIIFFISSVNAQGTTLSNSVVSSSNNNNNISVSGNQKNQGNGIETSPSPVPLQPGSISSPGSGQSIPNSNQIQSQNALPGNGPAYGSPGGLPSSLYQNLAAVPAPARPTGSGYPLKQIGVLPYLFDSPRQPSQALLLNPSGYNGQQQQQQQQPQPGGYGTGGGIRTGGGYQGGGGGGGGGGGYGNQGNIQPYGPSASPNCVDVHSKCDYFVALGKCQNQFAPFVRQVCPRSCNACEVLPYGMTSSNSDNGYGGGPGQHAQLAPGSYLFFGPPFTNLGPATGSGGCCGGNTGGQSNGYIPGGAAFVGNGLSYNPGGALPGCGSNNPGGCGQIPSGNYGGQNQNQNPNPGAVYPGGSGCTNPGGCPTLPGQSQNQYPGGGSGCTNPGGCPTLPGQTTGTGGSYGGGGVVPAGQSQYPSGSGCTNPGGCPTLPGQTTGTGTGTGTGSYGGGGVVPAGQGQYPSGSGCTNPGGCPTLPGQNQGGNYPGTGYNDANGVGEAIWSEWSAWGICRSGAQYRSRTCDYSDTVGQNGCRGKSYESQSCSGTGCSSPFLNAPCDGQQSNSLGYNGDYEFKSKLRLL